MPHENIRGVAIHYEVTVSSGPFVALVTGGRQVLAGEAARRNDPGLASEDEFAACIRPEVGKWGSVIGDAKIEAQ
jgi:hypothetical protein